MIEKKGNLESAKRALQLCGAVFRYAVATARLASDPTRDLRGALVTPTVTHYGAIIDPVKVGELLRAIDGHEGQGLTRYTLQLAPHVTNAIAKLNSITFRIRHGTTSNAFEGFRTEAIHLQHMRTAKYGAKNI